MATSAGVAADDDKLMARSTRMHLPEDEYLLLVGQAAYMVSSLEGLVIFDLPGLAAHLPPALDVAGLSGMTTKQIANALTAAAGDINDDDVRTYIALAGRLLGEASSRRNDLLHSRPATVEEGTRLYRWKSDDRGPRLEFPIETGLAARDDRLSVRGLSRTERRQAASQEFVVHAGSGLRSESNSRDHSARRSTSCSSSTRSWHGCPSDAAGCESGNSYRRTRHASPAISGSTPFDISVHAIFAESAE